MAVWQQDVLGERFESTVLDLGTDDEGPVVATLVRSLPRKLTVWQRLVGYQRELESIDVLYVHGWSDYFFQRALASFFTDRGARFFALDLRKYGRSLREGQTPGYIDRLEQYDEEISMALGVMGQRDGQETSEARETISGPRGGAAEDGRPRKLVLLGHSTGGLVLSLYAHRHRGVADALVLNSPWLELQLSSIGRRAIAPIVHMSARYLHHEQALPQLDFGHYSQAQQAWVDPDEWATLNTQWRPPKAMTVRTGWLAAILNGHDQISRGIDVGAPVCVLLSSQSALSVGWQETMLRADSVLDVDEVARAALHLGDSVTVQRINGALHDVFLSEPQARHLAYARLGAWLKGWRAAIAES